MSQGTTFRVIAFDKKNKLSEKEVMDLAVKDCYQSIAWGAKKSEEETKKEIEKNGMAPFLRILEDQNEEDRQYNQYRQKADPFPMWVDTKTGCVGHELMAHDFTSNFDKLYEHYGLHPEGPKECIEITKDEVYDMLRVLDYIKLGKYDKDLEETFFNGNSLFHVFEAQFFNFSIRFRKKKQEQKNENNQIVTIVIKDERDLSGKEKNYDIELLPSQDMYDSAEEEEEESRRDEEATIEYLHSILSAFLLMEPRYFYKDSLEYKLVYHKWI